MGVIKQPTRVRLSPYLIMRTNMIGWFYLNIAVAYYMTTCVFGSTMLDLNHATASLRVTEPLNAAPQPSTHSKVPLASVFVTAMTLLSMVACYILKPSTFAKATNYAQWAARNMLVYALTDRKAAPSILQDGKTRKAGMENKKMNTPMSRSDFTLSSSLDFLSLAASTRQEYAPAMDNTLMRATLERPTIDSITLSFKKDCCPNCTCCSSACQAPAQVPASLFEAQLEKLSAEEQSKQGKKKKINELSKKGLGRKPDIRRLKDLQDHVPGHVKKSKANKFKGFRLDEVEEEADEEHDWETDPRVSPVLHWDKMEGPDAGCTPLHTLYLPPAAKKAKDYGICGRSLISVDQEPTFEELYPPPTRSVVENKKFLGWTGLKKASKQTVRKNALRKGKKPVRSVPAFSLD